MSAQLLGRAALVWAVVLACLLASPGAAGAETRATRTEAFEMRTQLHGGSLGKYIEVLRDDSGKLAIDDVVAPALSAKFEGGHADEPSFGLTESAYWVRFSVHNDGVVAQPWLLELAYPMLDEIALYEPRPDGGFTVRISGDMHPFAQRDLPYRNVVFALEEPAGSTRTYYARLQTSGSLVVALRGWTLLELFDNQNIESPVIWMFYGLIVVMGFYNLFLFVLVRQSEHFLYALYAFAMGALSFTMNGHLFQYALPSSPQLANRLIPVTVALLYTFIVLFAHKTLDVKELFPPLHRFTRYSISAAVAIALFSLVGPYAWCIRATTSLGFSLMITGPWLLFRAARVGSRPAKLFLIAWTCLILGAIAHYAQLVGLLPSVFLTRWGIQLGASLETVLLSVALAERINELRARLGVLNDKLTHNVSDLRLALSRAEQATRVKSEFLATMSHELRTPLNAIINIPQAISDDFRELAALRCSGCGTTFELDRGEQVGSREPCPECQRAGTLAPQALTQYEGVPSETLQHLSVVERAGKHLLLMVNDILDFTKMEAGRVALKLADVEVCVLLSDALETVAEPARRRGIQVVLAPDLERVNIKADSLRIKQVLINVVGNAVKFSPAQGTVYVSARREGDSCIFSVRDEGIGIAHKDQARVFLTFEQVHQGDTRNHGGTGLGLSISRTLVELHDGEIWVESEPGKGATFSFRLPIAGPGRTLPSESTAPVRASTTERPSQMPPRDRRLSA